MRFDQLATLLFGGSILHIFSTHLFASAAHRLKNKHPEKTWRIGVLQFLGCVEIVFALWAIPLLIALGICCNFSSVSTYLRSREYTEVIFLVTIMSIAATPPIVGIAERFMRLIARTGREWNGPVVWWLVILTVGPLLGSFITEIGAMTLCALLLLRYFFVFSPSHALGYATLALLFVNISVGGMLTTYAAPAVLIIARKWQWDGWFMFSHFGWRIILAICMSNLLYYLWFRKELHALSNKIRFFRERGPKIPLTISSSLFYLALLFTALFFSQWIPIQVGLLVILIMAHNVFFPHSPLHLQHSFLVGLFFAGLIIHGGMQVWWLEPLLERLTNGSVFAVCLILSPFNDNAAITYLLTLVPNLSEPMKIMAVSGAVAGGGLTVIANAPNPAGQLILKERFGGSISPLKLFLNALLPTLCVIVALTLWTDSTPVPKVVKKENSAVNGNAGKSQSP